MGTRISSLMLVGALLVLWGSGYPASAQTEANKAIVQRVVDEIWNQGNLAAVDELYHRHYGHYDPNFTQADDLAGLLDCLRQFGRTV